MSDESRGIEIAAACHASGFIRGNWQGTTLLQREGFGRLLLHRKEKIPVSVNGRSVLAKVVDECDSVYGCHEDHECTTLNPMPQQHLNASRAL
jgi:hypothetical protein